MRAGTQSRRFANDASTFYFINLAVGIGDFPVPAKQAHGFLAVVFDANAVRKAILFARWIRVHFQILRLSKDPDIQLGDLFSVRIVRCHRSKLPIVLS